MKAIIELLLRYIDFLPGKKTLWLAGIASVSMFAGLAAPEYKQYTDAVMAAALAAMPVTFGIKAGRAMTGGS